MKKKILYYTIIIFFFSTSFLNSQITVSPEIGISYLPFKIFPRVAGSFIGINSKEINFLLGVSAQMPIYKKWDAKLRISYTNRNDVEWVETGDFGPGSDFEWKHQDLNIDLNIHYKLSKNLYIGIGPSLIRSFMEFKSVPHNGGNIYHGKSNRFFFGLNSSISFEIKKISINLMYLRTNRYNGKPPSFTPFGNNRLDLTIGYRIGKGR